MNSNIIYLENSVESTASLPPELQRILATIKDLDLRSQALTEQIDEQVEICLSKPSQAARKIGGEHANEVAELRQRIEEDQQMLVHFAEEKLALAQQCFDLVDLHIVQVERDIESFEQELLAEAAMEEGVPMETYTLPEEIKKQRQRDLELEREAKEAKRREREEADMRRREAEEQRLLQQQAALAAQTALYAKQQEALQQQQAALAAQQAALQAQVLPGLAGGPAAGVLSPGQLRTHKSAARGEMGMGLGGEDRAPAPVSHFPPVPPGMNHSASTPQAPGRLLQAADIRPELVGRRAELFWPDDNLWYLVDFFQVDVMARKAQIMYTTGETEELNLDEIVREGHMSLITV